MDTEKQISEDSPVPTELSAAKPVPTKLSEAKPVPASLSTTSLVPTELSAAKPVPTELSAAKPVPTIIKLVNDNHKYTIDRTKVAEITVHNNIIVFKSDQDKLNDDLNINTENN